MGFSEQVNDGISAADGASLVFVLDDSLEGVSAEALGKAAQLIYMGTALPDAARGADLVLPITNVAEEDGTFTNRDGHVQRYVQAKSPPGMARPAWWVLGEIVAQIEDGEPFVDAADAFSALSNEIAMFSGLSYSELGYEGRVVTLSEAEVSA